MSKRTHVPRRPCSRFNSCSLVSHVISIFGCTQCAGNVSVGFLLLLLQQDILSAFVGFFSSSFLVIHVAFNLLFCDFSCKAQHSMPIISIPHSSAASLLSAFIGSFLLPCWRFVTFLARPTHPHSPFKLCISLIGLYWFCSLRHKTTRPHFVYQLDGWAEWLYSRPRYHALLYGQKNTGNLSKLLHKFTQKHLQCLEWLLNQH